jgi:hypothetical protein
LHTVYPFVRASAQKPPTAARDRHPRARVVRPSEEPARVSPRLASSPTAVVRPSVPAAAQCGPVLAGDQGATLRAAPAGCGLDTGSAPGQRGICRRPVCSRGL